MPKRRLIWILFPSFLLIIILAIVGVTWYVTVSMKRLYLEETAEDLKARTALVQVQLGAAGIENSAAVDSLCKLLGNKSSTRFTVILPNGIVIGDTEEDPLAMDNHAARPEVAEVISGNTGIATRYSYTVHETMMYIASPLKVDGNTVAIVRAALPVTALDREFKSIYPRIITAGIIIAFLAGALSFYISRRITRPLQKMRQVASQYSKGEFGERLPPASSVEIEDLANALNHMAMILDEKIKTIVGQRNELNAILSSMVEGLVVFDTTERLIKINETAAKMLGLDSDVSRGRYIQETLRHPSLQRMVKEVLDSRLAQESEIELHDEDKRILQIRGAVLKNDLGETLGALIVLNDITSLRKLESIRRDFVANVSHELRTPITSIKGFVETLREGALENKSDAIRFLDIISRQTDRLNSIIEDLLTLSAIEEGKRPGPALENHDLKSVLLRATEICGKKAKAKGISVKISCDENLKANINPDLLEQAVVNLLDNAIKYSDENSGIDITASEDETAVRISVADKGCGIERKHIPRIFERFYTVDKARSRELGGTGLGLAIVKHIAQLHGGTVDVKSDIGRGSIFTIRIPK